MARKSRDVECWVVLVEVEALTDSREFRKGERAFVNVVVPERTEGYARQKAKDLLFALGFRSIDVDEVTLLDLDAGTVPKRSEVRRLAKAAIRTGEPQWGSFHSWDDS